ncbi:MAG: hypothetical protein ACYSOI_06940, partial [Planctomycetota bacterium]
ETSLRGLQLPSSSIINRFTFFVPPSPKTIVSRNGYGLVPQLPLNLFLLFQTIESTLYAPSPYSVLPVLKHILPQ